MSTLEKYAFIEDNFPQEQFSYVCSYQNQMPLLRYNMTGLKQ